MTKINDVAAAIDGVLLEYQRGISEDVKTGTLDTIKDLVKETKATAPVGTRAKHYKDQITYKKKYVSRTGAAYLWYVKGSDYRLSHLLNNGHALRNGGRYRGTQFITKAHDKAVVEHEKRIDDIIAKWRSLNG